MIYIPENLNLKQQLIENGFSIETNYFSNRGHLWEYLINRNIQELVIYSKRSPDKNIILNMDAKPYYEKSLSGTMLSIDYIDAKLDETLSKKTIIGSYIAASTSTLIFGPETLQLNFIGTTLLLGLYKFLIKPIIKKDDIKKYTKKYLNAKIGEESLEDLITKV